MVQVFGIHAYQIYIYITPGAAPESWLRGGQVIILQSFLQHKFKSPIFKICKNINNMIHLIYSMVYINYT
jgi:hypothetical protein